MKLGTGEIGRAFALFKEGIWLTPASPGARYKGFDRRRRGSGEISPASARRMRLRVVLAAVIATAVSLGLSLLGSGIRQVATPPRIDTFADIAETAFMLLAALSAVSAMVAKRLCGRAEPVLFGAGVALAFVLSPLAFGVPPALHRIYPQSVELATVAGVSMLVVGIVLIAVAPIWPQVDSRLSLPYLLAVIAATLGAVGLALLLFPGLRPAYAAGISPVFLGGNFAGESPLARNLAGLPWLALAALYWWRGRLVAGSRRLWTGAGLALIGAAFYYNFLAVPAGSPAELLGALLAAAGQLLVLIGSVSALDAILEVKERELREAETARRSLELAREASRESSQRYLHDLRSSVAGVSLLLESLVNEKPKYFRPAVDASRMDELIRREVGQMRAMARQGPSGTAFDLGETLDQWMREQGLVARIKLDIPAGEVVFGPRELLLDVLTLLTSGAHWHEPGAEAPRALLSAVEAAGRVVLEVRGVMAGAGSPGYRAAVKGAPVRLPAPGRPVSPLLLEACGRALSEQDAEMWLLAGGDGLAVALPRATGAATSR